MLRAIVLAPSASLRERLRALAQGPELEIAAETGDARRAHVLARHADVLIVAGASLLSQVASHLDPDPERATDRDPDDDEESDFAAGDAIDVDRFDRELPAYAIVAISNDRRVTATLEGLPVRGWAVLPDDPMMDGRSRDVLRAAIVAADAGLGAMPVEWTARVRDRSLDWSVEAVADEHLTGREHEVLEWLSQGLSNRRIGERLGISEHTVKFHITAIYGKLGASTRTEAVNRALRRGWLRI